MVAPLERELDREKKARMSGGLGVDPRADRDEEADIGNQKRSQNTVAEAD